MILPTARQAVLSASGAEPRAVVGIVVVSHSRALARAVVALAQEMLNDVAVPIVIAAGLDEETFGTDAVQIRDAIVQADLEGASGSAGVVVLMDLGSAVLSAELALELLADDDLRERVLLCPAPLVEGLVVAAVTAGTGASRQEVAAEAGAALTAKRDQLAPPDPGSASSPAPEPASAPTVAAASAASTSAAGRFTVGPVHGLHARPLARLVQVVRTFDARVELRNQSVSSGWVPGASLTRLATLGAVQGHQVEVRASGGQAEAAVAAVVALAERNFDETAVPGGAPSERSFAADGPFPASPGIGIGPALLVGAVTPAYLLGELAGAGGDQAAVPTATGSPEGQRRRLAGALTVTREQISGLRARVAAQTGESDAAIFDAHLGFLDDQELLDDADSRIDDGRSAVAAWSGAVTVAADGLKALTDQYLRARADDVHAVGNQVLANLLADTDADIDAVNANADDDDPANAADDVNADGASPPDSTDLLRGRTGVLVVPELTPAQAAMLDPERAVAVVLAFGSPTAHSSILLRARGIPAVVGTGEAVLRLAEGTVLAVDGTTGELAVDPSAELLERFRQRSASAGLRRRRALAHAADPALTRDGVKILVGANVGSLEDAVTAAASGADLVGLVRTEFLFLGREQAPDVDEQEAVYRALAEAIGGRRLTLRTLDVGGDKPLAYLPMPAEANPFLGVRGIRLALRRPALLADQLLAIVRVAHDVPMSVMFPMVSTLAEVIAARRILEQAIARDGRGQPAGLQVGIMIEVPAAALKAAALAPHLDFFSIGTNDLTQYTLAAERGNTAVAGLADPLDPGVLALIGATCRGAAGAGTTVAVCGELAADERATSLLVGLGVRELSVTPRAVPGVKAAVRDLLLADAQSLATECLTAASADVVRERVSVLPAKGGR